MHSQLNVAVESVEGLGITRERARRLKSHLLNLRPVLRLFFQIVLIVMVAFQINGWVVPRKTGLLTSVAYLLVPHVSLYLNF